jgi:hypothetical protein
MLSEHNDFLIEYNSFNVGLQNQGEEEEYNTENHLSVCRSGLYMAN